MIIACGICGGVLERAILPHIILVLPYITMGFLWISAVFVRKFRSKRNDHLKCCKHCPTDD